MAKTLQERFVAALQAKGLHEVKRTHKYIVFIRDQGLGYYYIGKSGSLRMGSTVAQSIPCSNRFKAELLGLPGGI